ncbi:MAG: hypothetical protein WC974_02885 [Thermoplasmata archaeon]
MSGIYVLSYNVGQEKYTIERVEKYKHSWPNHLTKYSSESYRHFMAKSCLFYLLRKMGHDLRTEWKVPNGYVDIVDMTTRVMYELEFHVAPSVRNRKIEQYRQPGFEIIIINCSRLPDDINAMMEYVERYVVPD